MHGEAITSPTPLPHGPKGRWLTGNLTDFGRDPLGFLDRCAQEYGDYVPLRFLNKRAIIINDPRAIEEVLVTQNRNFTKTSGFRTPFMDRLFGNGLLTSEGATWARQRRMAQPAFHRGQMAAYASSIVGFAERLIHGWQPGETRPIHSDLTKLTTQVVVKVLFDCDVPPEIEEMEQASLKMMERFSSPRSGWGLVANFLPVPGARRFEALLDRTDAFIYRSIEQRRARGNGTGDLLSTLIEARDEHGDGMSDRQLRDELMTLMGAGLDTTALALSWSCYLLARHPAVAEKLRDELRTVLNGRPPEFGDIRSLPFTDAVFKEAMRLYPPAWIMAREAARDCTLGGYPIARGTSILISQWLKHRDPRIFERPDEYIPARWLAQPAIPKFGYFPFGGGPRLCIGNGLAQLEAPLALATICQKFTFECDPDYVVKLLPSITLQPKGGIHLRVQPVPRGEKAPVLREPTPHA